MTYYFPSSADDSDASDHFGCEPAGTDEQADVSALRWDPFDEWDAPEGEFEFVELEHSELDRRLRNLAWPAPPQEVRDRCFGALVEAGLLGSCPPPPPVHPKPPTPLRQRPSEKVQRYELTRRKLELLSSRVWSSPRREQRFAATL